MSDFNSSLPVRTQSNGDVVVNIADGTIESQKLAVDSTGRITIKLDDSAGNGITSVTNGGRQALDVVDQADGPVSPGTAAAYSVLIGGQYNSSLPTLTTGQQAAVQVDSSGRVILNSATSSVAVSNFPATVDTNYGVVGASTIRTAAEIGNATGAADFNYGAVGAQTLRVAAEPGNASGIADFNNGATGAQTLRVAANLAVAGANVSGTNPVPIQIVTAPVGTTVNNYNTASAVAAGGTSNHIYTITSGKTFNGKKIWASASGKLKIEVRVSPDGATYSTLWVGFSSTANPNITIDLDQLVFLESGVGSTVEIIRTNEDNQAMDVYSTISGVEM